MSTTNIFKTNGYNNFRWNNLTEGKLMAIGEVMRRESLHGGNILARDIYCEIRNFFFTFNKYTYDMLENIK